MFFPNKGSPDPVKHITVFNSELLFKCLTELVTSSAEGYRKELREYQALFLKKEGLIQCGGGGELWEEFELVSASQGKKQRGKRREISLLPSPHKGRKQPVAQAVILLANITLCSGPGKPLFPFSRVKHSCS